MIEQYAPTAGQVATYLAIVLVFLSLIILILVHEKKEKRKRCMMNHPAGSRAKIEPSPTGQTKPISPNPMFPEYHGVSDAILKERYKGGQTWPLPHSSVESSSRPHHLEGD